MIKQLQITTLPFMSVAGCFKSVRVRYALSIVMNYDKISCVVYKQASLTVFLCHCIILIQALYNEYGILVCFWFGELANQGIKSSKFCMTDYHLFSI